MADTNQPKNIQPTTTPAKTLTKPTFLSRWFSTESVGEVGPSGNVTDQVTLFTNRFDPFAPSYFDDLEPWTFTVDYWNSQPIGQALYEYDQPQPFELDTRFGPSLIYEQDWKGITEE